MGSRIHSGLGLFEREARRQADLHPDKAFVCPYCIEALDDRRDEADEDAPRPAQHPNLSELRRHIRRSNAQKIHGSQPWMKDKQDARRHAELVEQAGWYAEDWSGSAELRKTERRVKRLREQQWLDQEMEVSESTYDQKEVEPCPVSTVSHSHWGGRGRPIPIAPHQTPYIERLSNLDHTIDPLVPNSASDLKKRGTIAEEPTKPHPLTPFQKLHTTETEVKLPRLN